MNDYLSILKNDLLNVIDILIKRNIIIQNFNKNNLTIDYLSKSKQGDVSTNLFILLKSQLIKKKYDLRKDIYDNMIKFNFFIRKSCSKKILINPTLVISIFLTYSKLIIFF